MNGNRLNYLFNDVNIINNIKTVSLENIDDIKLNKKKNMNIRSFKVHIKELMILLGRIENKFDV